MNTFVEKKVHLEDTAGELSQIGDMRWSWAWSNLRLYSAWESLTLTVRVGKIPLGKMSSYHIQSYGAS